MLKRANRFIMLGLLLSCVWAMLSYLLSINNIILELFIFSIKMLAFGSFLYGSLLFINNLRVDEFIISENSEIQNNDKKEEQNDL